MEIVTHRFLAYVRNDNPLSLRGAGKDCDVGVSQAGAQFAATKEILTSDMPSSSE